MFQFNEHIVKYSILAGLCAQYLWDVYLTVRQYKKVQRTTKVPKELESAMTPDTFEKARRYTQARARFGFFKDTLSITTSVLSVVFNMLPIVWNYAETLNTKGGEMMTSCIWIFLISAISYIVDIPLSIYNTFWLEEEFGFNKQTVAFFIADKIKGFILMQILIVTVSSVIVLIVKNGGEYFFVWLWLVVCIMFFIILMIYPSVIAPIFDKYTPLPDGELRSQIEALASNLNFPLAQLYVVEGSKRSSHSNAYFYGLFRTKRIVLFDTLLAKDDGSTGGCSNDEILAVLSHELGHWHFNHVFKNIFIMQVNLFLTFAGFNILFKSSVLYRAIGFHKTQPIIVGLILVLQYVMMPYNMLLGFLMTCLSRKFEFQADKFAMSLGKAKHLISSLIQLNKDNLGFPIYDDLYSAWHHSHPPLLERIRALEGEPKKKK